MRYDEFMYTVRCGEITKNDFDSSIFVRKPVYMYTKVSPVTKNHYLGSKVHSSKNGGKYFYPWGNGSGNFLSHDIIYGWGS